MGGSFTQECTTWHWQCYNAICKCGHTTPRLLVSQRPLDTSASIAITSRNESRGAMPICMHAHDRHCRRQCTTNVHACLLLPKLNALQPHSSSVPPYWSVGRDSVPQYHSIVAYLSPSTIWVQFNHLCGSPTRQECNSLSLELFFMVFFLNHASNIQTMKIAHANCTKLSCSLCNLQLHSSGRIFSTPF